MSKLGFSVMLVVCMTAMSFGAFVDNFENGLGNWDYAAWMSPTTFTAGAGNPGIGGEYAVGANTSAVWAGAAWNAAGLAGVVDTDVSLDIKIIAAGATYNVVRNMDNMWNAGSRQGVRISGGTITVLGAATPASFTSTNLPAGVTFDFSGWNHFEFIGEGTELTINLNGHELWNGATVAGSNVAGPVGLMTGWTGHAILDNVSANVVPEPATMILLSIGSFVAMARRKR